MTIAGIKNHFMNWREWEMNPIVIKELRQAVRSWTVTGMLLLFLVVLFITSIGFLVTESFQINANERLGGTMFSSFIVILAGASLFFIPLYVGVRVAAERLDNNPDLLYVTTLSPARIILGKFLCGAYVTLLFFSACMPFMAFTNLLRGVDLPTVFFILFFLFLIVCMANMIAIFLACLPMSRPFKILFAIYGIFQSIGIISSVIGTSFLFLRTGLGASMAGRDFWLGTLTFCGAGLAFTGLFYVLSVALITPASANRALPIRIYVTIVWLLGGLLSFGWVVQTGEATRIFGWVYPTFLVMIFALLIVISNSDQLSLRVRRTIPKPGLKRMAAFLFFNGAAGGILWVLMLSVTTLFVAWELLGAYSTSSVDLPQWFLYHSATMSYVLAYALTALFIHRKFFLKRPPKFAGLLAILLAGGWALVPNIVLFFMNKLSWHSVEGLQLGNVFNVFSLRDSQPIHAHLIFSLVWLALMIVLNARWFLREGKNFRPPLRVTAENSPPILP